jgi:hypothetical protein
VHYIRVELFTRKQCCQHATNCTILHGVHIILSNPCMFQLFHKGKDKKGKRYPCAWLIKHYALKTCEGGGKDPPFLTSTPDGGYWSASRPARLTFWERAPSTYWIRGWIGTRSSLDVVKKRKSLASTGNRTPVFQPVYRRYAGWAIVTQMFSL